MYAIRNTLANVCLLINSPVSYWNSATACCQLFFNGENNPTSSGCVTCDECGGRQYSRIPLASQNLEVSKSIWDE